MPRIATTDLIANPRRYGYDFRIDRLLLRAAIGPERPMTIQSSDVQEGQSINVKQNPEDFTSNIGRVFSRSNFSAGQGLDTAHRSNGQPDDVNRFWDSKGIDVFHADDETSYSVHLLHTMQDEGINFTSSNNYLTQTTDGKLWVTDANKIYKSINYGDTWTQETTGNTHNFTGITSVGNRVFATTANNDNTASELLEYTSSWNARTTAQTSSGGLNGIWFYKGVLIIAGDDATVERVWVITPFNQTWSSSDLADGDALVSFESTHSVSQVIDAGAVILVASTNGDIYSIKDNAGTWALRGQTHIPFEEVHSIAATEGIVFFGTKDKSSDVGRFYRAELLVANDLHVLGQRQLIKEWNISGQNTTPKFMFVSRDSVYMGIKEGSSESYLWRYYLPTGGIARDLKASAGGLVTGITNSAGKFIMVVAGADIWRETSTYESTGYLITSAADFFTAESKQFVGAELSTKELDANVSVDLYYNNNFEDLDNPDSTNYNRAINQISGTGDTEKQIKPVARYIIGKLVLNSENGVNTPYVKSIQFRALARPELVVAQIPVNISDRVERPGRKPLRVKSLGESVYQELRLLEGDAVTLEIFDPNEVIKGVVEQISYPITTNSERGSVLTYATITVRGTRQTTVVEPSSTVVFGIGKLGEVRFGG
tara:strand:+ start:28631 stop:30598 length:1968 start_codon:yes stop_codon:yes gene_type:complete